MSEPGDDIRTGGDVDGLPGGQPTGSDPRESHPLPDPRHRLAQADPIDETELIELLCQAARVSR